MYGILNYIYTYEHLTIEKGDLQKRKRVKNVVPFCDRCKKKEQMESNVHVGRRMIRIFVELILREYRMDKFRKIVLVRKIIREK